MAKNLGLEARCIQVTSEPLLLPWLILPSMIYAYLLLTAVEVESANGAPSLFLFFLSLVRGNLCQSIIWQYWMVLWKSQLAGLFPQQQIDQFRYHISVL